jgi:hypothetical protein
MNEPFVPLNKAAMPSQSEADFRVSIVSKAENLRPFRPLGHASGKAGHQCEPRVCLQCDGERVSAIRIQCGCGQVIELACVYQTAPATAIS